MRVSTADHLRFSDYKSLYEDWSVLDRHLRVANAQLSLEVAPDCIDKTIGCKQSRMPRSTGHLLDLDAVTAYSWKSVDQRIVL